MPKQCGPRRKVFDNSGAVYWIWQERIDRLFTLRNLHGIAFIDIPLRYSSCPPDYQDFNVKKSLAQVTAQIEKLQKEAEAIRARELHGVIARIKEAIRHYGLTSTDLGLNGPRGGGRRSAVRSAVKKRRSRSPRRNTGVIKFRSADGQQTWTGHGRAPNWFRFALQAGATRESLLVK
jgi:DNA-binding protein H-NS